MDLTAITQAFADAKAAADKLATTDDGGTCNMDCVAITLSRSLRYYKVEAAAKAAGILTSKSKWLGDTVAFAYFGQGQANRRSRMNEAARTVLKSAGLPAGMYYQMD
jgi:hypothetical protein